MKKKLLLGVLAFGVSVGVGAEPLSDLDAQLLLEKLKQLRDGNKGRTDSKLVAAHVAFSAAAQSDADAHELYLKCVEKVRFEDEKRSGQEFREWKRSHKEREDTQGFRRALRHQLAWLVLTIEVAMKPEEKAEKAKTALDRLDAVLRDAVLLDGNQSMVRANVLGTVFARAYEIGGLEVEDWPDGPLQIDSIYEQLIFPPLRRPDKVESLRAAWLRRINQEGEVVANWSRPAARNNDTSAGVERFLTERRPELIWSMETDLFKAGDQKAAALRMLHHIERYLGHASEKQWIEDFEALVLSKDAPSDAEARSAEDSPGGDDGAGS